MVTDSKSFLARVNRVRKFKNSFELLQSFSPKARIILNMLGAGNSERDAAKAACAGKSTVTYWKDKFVSLGLLELVTRDVFQIFRFTPSGSKLVTRSEGCCLVVLEDFAWKFEVLGGERRRIEWEKLGEPCNWVKLGCRVGGVRVVRTLGRVVNVIVHPGRFKGFGDPRDLEYLAVRVVFWVKGVLEDKFGMVLGEGSKLHEPVFRFPSEEAVEDVKHGTVVVEGVGSVDASPPERRPHEEYRGVERARARLLLPDTVRRLELKVDGMNENLMKLADVMEKVADSLNKLLPRTPDGNGDDYVS